MTREAELLFAEHAPRDEEGNRDRDEEDARAEEPARERRRRRGGSAGIQASVGVLDPRRKSGLS